eukprot:g74711.t1
MASELHVAQPDVPVAPEQPTLLERAEERAIDAGLMVGELTRKMSEGALEIAHTVADKVSKVHNTVLHPQTETSSKVEVDSELHVAQPDIPVPVEQPSLLERAGEQAIDAGVMMGELTRKVSEGASDFAHLVVEKVSKVGHSVGDAVFSHVGQDMQGKILEESATPLKEIASNVRVTRRKSAPRQVMPEEDTSKPAPRQKMEEERMQEEGPRRSKRHRVATQASPKKKKQKAVA